MSIPRGSAFLIAWICAAGLVAPLVSVAAAPVPAAAVAPASVPAHLGGRSVWAHFANPRAHGGRDSTIHDEVVRLISATPAGATIRGTIYSLSVRPVARALLAAEQRGVTVQILLDGDNSSSTSPAVAIIRQLSQARFCTVDPTAYGSPTRAGGGCVTTSDKGDLHVKMFTFTETADPNGVLRSDVSWFSSANMTYTSGSDQFNNAVTVYDDVALTRGLNSYFTDLWDRRHYAGDDYYDFRVGRGYDVAPSASFFASPEGRGQTDTAASRLDDLTPDSRCQIRIGMSFVTSGRPKLLKQITRSAAKGCRVRIVVSSRGGAIRMSRGVYTDLLRAGVSIRRTSSVHDKFFVVYARYGSRYQYRVYTGSQNWSRSALTSNDELFVKLAPESASSHPLYDGFKQHFNDAWSAGRTCTTTSYPCR